jgi:predicted nucleic acid-binding protein
MTRSRVVAFVDCNILIEGFLHPLHPAQGVIIMAANKRLDLITCKKVVEDIEDVILEEAEKKNDYQLVEAWAALRKQTRLKVMPDPPAQLVEETYKKYLGVMRHADDISVLASVIELGPDLILSDNTEHFNDKVAERCGIPIWSSVQFLENLAGGLIKEKLKIQ